MMVTLNYGEGEVRYLSDRDVEELNHVRLAIQQALSTKLNNAGIYFHSMSRVKTESSIKNKLAKGKYSSDGGGKKIQDLIGIRINLFYSEDIGICESILEDTFSLITGLNLKMERIGLRHRNATVYLRYQANI